MKNKSRIFLSAAAVAGLAIFASCADENRIIGAWETTAPQPVVPTISGTISSTQTTTIEFAKGTDSKSGPMKLTTIYEMTLPGDSTATAPLSTVNATISGTWTREDGDDDDYILAFDKNSLSVNAVSAPELGPVTEEFLSSISRFSTLEDVEVNKEKTIMTFEDQRDTKYVLKYLAPAATGTTTAE